ncbi:MAG: TetR/AcrR family transcriptional regulator [Burkholderiaceae bacterium]|jgi:TetR/AcrR family transcriptional repressor of nem operon
MSRVSREQALRNREAIADVSARMFREKGFQAVSVSDLMSAAGLTHGGFYGHFSSKDELIATACARAFEQSRDRWEARAAAAPTPTEGLRSIVENYLTQRQRDHYGRSCPLTCLAVDVGREGLDKPVRAAFRDGLASLASVLMKLVPGRDRTKARQLALAQLSTLVGAVVLARATHGDPVSDEILESVRDWLGVAPEPAK